MPKPLNLVVACAENRVIGRNNQLPWHIPEDMAHFHRITAGQTVVLGRICFETWPRVALDGRRPVVITSRPAAQLTRRPHGDDSGQIESIPLTAASVEAALALAEDLPGEIMICGGQRIYETVLESAQKIYLTLVHAEVPGDVFFPEWRHLSWRVSERRESCDDHYRYTFSTWDRI